ncbi:YkgJ family cysteine cluster protein [Chondromyces apiculatus]|uniref:YkgJ family cysteine cluster protein n=1 Tax=Chondromyces apiculatus DSM 436 TaxID=1192034 RepID=A0A017T3I9_9BACT|nr:YkgJ family cysteine cluster protein [Chondromyces apiculatus]EYF03824.1 Hypothetical protein CAP_5254 [Chondromyces apiculatus DSM 436]
MTNPERPHPQSLPEVSAREAPGAREVPSAVDPLAPPAPQRAATTEDLERALRFVHLVEMQTKARLAELSATVSALSEVLIGQGHVPLEAYEKRKHLTVLRENERSGTEAGVMLSDIPDKYALAALPEIDCEARIPLCKARCCALRFALSVQDLDERVVRWDYGRPYQIAQRPDGYCVHIDERSGGCTIYAQRPGVCRSYDCRRDRRIWTDFERRIPAP